ncbi:assimilatory sulfite reductase (NADPH) flavoprotein subunit [Coralloluteibacterium stylophorae]|uniref:assimilatory sulfite reductase (NADPH) n=2 Tax=Coralloluteibacterium stylophorae TaxID=1776034 RepID=A0AAP2C8L7_9GAMM|nr:assimilatory sulfite reductase (NADPH) flavoprotein subunit [Coralloluteibacterium stylophorae]MBS7456323.1 assimilatory sulfite reductase (NADPH) flavoprotein subunit [Coralloluteibacterium stylophorae]
MPSLPDALALPLPEPRRAQLAAALEGLDRDALWWISGYAAGLARGGAAAAPPATPAAASPPAASLTIVHGSQTGNARREAERLAAAAEAAGLAVRVLAAGAYPQRELAKERLLYVVISTQGEGDPPDDAVALLEFLGSRRAPKLPELHYAVLGLGDSSYPQFCAIGDRLDARLAELGARRVLPAAQADLDIETVAGPWRERVLAEARALLARPAAGGTVTPLRVVPHVPAPAGPVEAEVVANQPLSGRGLRGVHAPADKDVRHIELLLDGAGLAYEPGDALAVHAPNDAAAAAAVLAATGLDADAEVVLGDARLPLREALRTARELGRPARPFLAAHAARAGAGELTAMLEGDGAGDLALLLASHRVVDVLRRWPARWEAQALVEALRPLAPRSYSIASSRRRVGDEAHLLVDVLRYDAFGEARTGTASGFLAGLADGDRVPVRLEPNPRFRLPADGSRDIVMIGPGTGVAPFRGFVQERAETGASGRNWLLFGARHFHSDFHYQLEWQQALRERALHRLDLAFSRDQAEKVYVQDRLREHGRTLVEWIDGGAHLYVCGAVAMGRDVHAALVEILATHTGADPEDAAATLAALQAEGRYSRDVY